MQAKIHQDCAVYQRNDGRTFWIPTYGLIAQPASSITMSLILVFPKKNIDSVVASYINCKKYPLETFGVFVVVVHAHIISVLLLNYDFVSGADNIRN